VQCAASTSCSSSPRVARSSSECRRYPYWPSRAPPHRQTLPAWPPRPSDELPSPPFSPSSIAYAQSCVTPSAIHHFPSQTILAPTFTGIWRSVPVPRVTTDRLRWAAPSRSLGSVLSSLGGPGWVVDRGKGRVAPAPRSGRPERALPPWPSRGHGAPPSSHGLRPSRGRARDVACSGSVGVAPWPPN
jgi:hypothetical protein